MDSNNDIGPLWHRITGRVREELLRASPAEKDWMGRRLALIGDLQEQLHTLFLKADGPACCADCLGACCDRGKNHFTLVNLLSILHSGRTLPEPDFSAPCPFLAAKGCLLDISYRPFNCITFNCERVEGNLSPSEQQRFYALEKQLRGLYTEFDHRYAGSSLRGLFIRHERLGEEPFLGRKKTE